MAQSGKKLAEFKTWHKPNMETLQRTANRGSISTGFDIENSCKFEADNAETIATTNQAAGNQKTWTWSCWLKRTELGSLQTILGAGETFIRFDTPDIIQTFFSSGSSVSTNQVFRDTSAWYHLVWILDTTQATAADRSRIYINGSQITSFSAASYPAQNADLTVGGTGSSTNFLRLAQYWAGGRNYAGYMAEIHYLNGTVAEPTEFGEYDSDSGIWIPKQYTGGGYGTQGFYYKFDNASNLGEDSSGEGHDANSLGNITSADQATDTPTNNFCTLNPLYNYAYGNTITEGATKIYGAANNWGGGKATFGLTSGKWYWEIKQLSNGNTFMGLQTDGEDNISSGNAQSQNTSVVFYTDGTLQYSNGIETTTSAANSIVANSIVGFALDLDSSTQTIKVYLNGSLITAFGSSGTANLSTYNLANKTIFPFVALYDRTVNMNFGGYTVSSISSAASDDNGYGTFEYAPPSGYYALCTKNLAEYG